MGHSARKRKTWREIKSQDSIREENKFNSNKKSNGNSPRKRNNMNTYKIYEYDGYPFCSVKALKKRMAEKEEYEITIYVTHRYSHTGQMAFCITETFRIRKPKNNQP